MFDMTTRLLSMLFLCLCIFRLPKCQRHRLLVRLFSLKVKLYQDESSLTMRVNCHMIILVHPMELYTPPLLVVSYTHYSLPHDFQLFSCLIILITPKQEPRSFMTGTFSCKCETHLWPELLPRTCLSFLG